MSRAAIIAGVVLLLAGLALTARVADDEPMSEGATRLDGTEFGETDRGVTQVAVGNPSQSQRRDRAPAEPTLLRGLPFELSTASDATIFPESWEAEADPATPGNLGRAKAMVLRAAAKYPDELLRANLTHVFVLGGLRFDGIKAGGTNSLAELYLVCGTAADGYTDEYLEGSFHHELSSILLRNHPALLPEREWLATLPKGVGYLGNGTEAVRLARDGLEVDSSLFANGFLTEYSQASIEEDFNQLAGSLFLGERQLWEDLGRYPRLARKIQLVKEFYRQLDPRFTEEFFRGLTATEQ